MDKILTKIKKVTQNSSYYQSDEYLNATSLKTLPIITRQDVVENYEKIVSCKMPMIYTQTSGSNGIPLKVAWNYNEYLKSLISLWRLRAKHGISPTDFQMTCHSEFDTFGKKINNPIILFPNMISLSKLQYSLDILQEYMHKIVKFKPKWILAQPSFVYLIGKYLFQNAPELLEGFKYIELVGELLSPDIKMQIQEFFPNAYVVNMYGMQEFNGIMYEDNNVMKVIEENVFVEILDQFGNECNINEEGDIVVTGLQNSTFPLIRYNTKDRGKRIVSNGIEGYTITVGRSNDQFDWNGILYDGSLFFTIINEYIKCTNFNILQFQVIYSEDTFKFKLLATESLPDEIIIERDLSNIIHHTINIDIPIKVKIVLSAEGFLKCGNKIKYFINNNKTLKYGGRKDD